MPIRSFAPPRVGAGLAALAALLLAAVAAGRTASSRSPARPRLPFPLPATVRAALGRSIPADGRPRVIVYASQSCPHCYQEADRWTRVAAAAPDLVRAVQVVFVVATPAGVTTPSSLHTSSFPRVVDVGAKLAAPLQARVVPTTLVVDPGGNVRVHSAGQHTDSALRALLSTAGRVAQPQCASPQAAAGSCVNHFPPSLR